MLSEFLQNETLRIIKNQHTKSLLVICYKHLDRYWTEYRKEMEIKDVIPQLRKDVLQEFIDIACKELKRLDFIHQIDTGVYYEYKEDREAITQLYEKSELFSETQFKDYLIMWVRRNYWRFGLE